MIQKMPATVSCMLPVLVYPARDVTGAWLAHCLALDVMVQDVSPQGAIDRICGAVAAVVEDDLEQGLDPLGRDRAPQQDWDLFALTMVEGSPCSPATKVDLLSCRSIAVFINVQRPAHPAMNIEADDDDAPALPPWMIQSVCRGNGGACAGAPS